MNGRLALIVSLIPALLAIQVVTSAATAGGNTADSNLPQLPSEQNQYNQQTCDPVNDPSTCRPG